MLGKKNLSHTVICESGGVIFFRFPKNLYQVESVHFLDIEKSRKKSFVDAFTKSGKKLERGFIPQAGNALPTELEPADWFQVKRLKIVLRTSAAVSRLELVFCEGGGKDICGLCALFY